MKKIFMGALMSVLFTLLIQLTPVSADIIKGEIPLGGASKALSDFYDRGGSFYTDEELELLANVIYHENYCNGEYIMKLTGSVVLNRVKASWYPDTIKGVLYQKGQYSTVDKFYTTKIPDSVYDIARGLLIGGSIAPKEVVFQSMFKQGSGVYYTENHEYFCYW